jgi:hypothetical protein
MFTTPNPSLPAPPSLRHTVIPSDAAPPRLGIVSFMGSVERKGSWLLPRNLRVVGVMGAVVLDLREAQIPAGGTEIEIFVMFASVEIILPPGVRVESVGNAFGGNFELRMNGAIESRPDAPLIRIKGDVIFGNVETTVRYPNETERAARKRLRAENRGR